ncbi:lysosomal acid glucosylceramidase-like [Physella acuta]|uniref:lysosomal acid glucosylceramidase-like n=1 Tax=Physella acuta TaxID=109671 RepID=UPI0027DE372C|nr:lysosomal acid glucosylceramidase-like [Physella acuta]
MINKMLVTLGRVDANMSRASQILLLFSLLVISLTRSSQDVPCAPYTVKAGYIVCVCNSTYCDTVPSADPVPKGQYIVYTTSKDGQRFDKQVYSRVPTNSSHKVYKLRTADTRQTIIGFGGAFTDAAGINIASLPQPAQDNLINSYYSKEGIEYTVGRVPMASCDFSTHAYSYDDVPGDLSLDHFSLAPEDLNYKIPYIQAAMKVSTRPLKLFGSPWSAPAWMKTNNKMTGMGFLKGFPGGEYYKAWGNYFVKFLDEYSKHNISFWGLTAENEPTNGFVVGFPFQCMGFTPETQMDFIKQDLGPALHQAGYGNVKLMILDDQRPFAELWARTVLSDKEASPYVSGIALHWYKDTASINILDRIHQLFPDKFLFATEACEGSFSWEKEKVDLGSWDRAASYASDIISDLNHWVTGWTDWNLALNQQGGPNWVSNFVDSPVIVNAKDGLFYKQPMFYVMGHFSKFVVPGSVSLGTEAEVNDTLIEVTAFRRPDNSYATIIHNKGSEKTAVFLSDGSGGYLSVTSPGFSIQTVIWW